MENPRAQSNELKIVAHDRHVVPNDFTDVPIGGGGCLLIHGLTGNREEHGLFDSVKAALEERGLDVLRIDLRGHGESSIPFRKASLHGMLDDVRAAYTILGERCFVRYLIGLSLGGALANILADELAPQRMVLLAPVTSFRATFRNIARRREQKRETTTSQPSARFILQALAQNPNTASHSGIPTLIMHGRDDLLVPIRSSRVYAAKRSHVTLVELESIGHVLHARRNEIARKTTRWICGEEKTIE